MNTITYSMAEAISPQGDVIPGEGAITWHKYASTCLAITHQLYAKIMFTMFQQLVLSILFYFSILSHVQVPQGCPRCQLESIEVITLFGEERERVGIKSGNRPLGPLGARINSFSM